mgnify:CR=1 FL=1
MKEITGVSETTLAVKGKLRVLDLLEVLEQKGIHIRKFILPLGGNTPSPSMVILVNDCEIGALNGLETSVEEGDSVAFIPVVHGG